MVCTFCENTLMECICSTNLRFVDLLFVWFPAGEIIIQRAGWPSGLRRQFKALVFGRGFESHFSHGYFDTAMNIMRPHHEHHANHTMLATWDECTYHIGRQPTLNGILDRTVPRWIMPPVCLVCMLLLRHNFDDLADRQTERQTDGHKNRLFSRKYMKVVTE